MSASPSASVALPVSANGVRSGIVYAGAVVTSGAWLPVGVMKKPRFWTGPPWTVSPTKPVDARAGDAERLEVEARERAAELDLEAVLSSGPSSRPAHGWTVTVAPAGMIAWSAAVMPGVV